MHWELLSLEQEKDGDLRSLICVRNQTDEIRKIRFEPGFNGFLSGDIFSLNNENTAVIQPQTSLYISFTTDNWKSTTDIMAGQYI